MYWKVRSFFQPTRCRAESDIARNVRTASLELKFASTEELRIKV